MNEVFKDRYLRLTPNFIDIISTGQLQCPSYRCYVFEGGRR